MGRREYHWYLNRLQSDQRRDVLDLHGAGRPECWDVRTYTLVVTCGSCSATSNSVTVTVSPSPSVSDQCERFDEPVHWVFERTDADLGSERTASMREYQWQHERQSDQSVRRVRAYTVPAGLSAGTYVYTLVVTCGSCSATSNSVTVTVSPSPSVSISASGSDEPVRWVFERADADLVGEQLQRARELPVAPERQSNQLARRGATYTVPAGLSAGTYVYTLDCHVWQLQCDVEQCDGDGESRAERDDQCEWFDESVRWVFERA